MADLVKRVSHTMPGASIEDILDEVRRQGRLKIIEELTSQKITRPVHVINHVIRMYDLTYDELVQLLIMMGHEPEPWFQDVYSLVNDSRKVVPPPVRCWSCTKKT